MDDFPGMAALAPAMVTLGRCGATGVLCLEGPMTKAHLVLRRGSVTALASFEKRIIVSQRTLLERRLLQQHLEAAVCAGPLDLRYLADESATNVESQAAQIEDGPCSASLSLRIVRRLSRRVPLSRVRVTLGREEWVLRPSGRYLLEHGALFPRETAMLQLLSHADGTSLQACLSAGGGGSDAIRSLWALRMVGATGPQLGPYALLLRKHRQLRNGESLSALLDIRRGAGRREVNQAFRHMASLLHPDQIGTHAPAAARRVSERVIDGLCRAHAACRQSAPD